MKKNPLLVIGLVLLCIIVFGTIVFQEISGYTWGTLDGNARFRPPSSEHLFGTTEQGFDLFTGIWQGGRMSLFLAIVGTLPYVFFGVLFGILEGYFGNKTKAIISSMTTFMYAVPLIPILLIMSIFIAHFEVNHTLKILIIIFSYGLFSSPVLYKVIKAETMRINSEEYMRAAEMSGTGKVRIIFKHLLPNLMSQIVVAAVQFLSQVIIVEVILLFIGVSFPMGLIPTWGNLIPNLTGVNTFKEYYWIWFYPIMIVMTTTVSIKLISEGLRVRFAQKREGQA